VSWRMSHEAIIINRIHAMLKKLSHPLEGSLESSKEQGRSFPKTSSSKNPLKSNSRSHKSLRDLKMGESTQPLSHHREALDLPREASNSYAQSMSSSLGPSSKSSCKSNYLLHSKIRKGLEEQVLGGSGYG
jgi:hypothetical protein